VDQIAIKLSRDEFDTLLLALGYATGAADRDGNRRFFYAFMRITNAVNRDNPNFTPYAIEEEDETPHPG
jgi:hypothetical protein